ncbi:MAG: type I methionyl aminopeptidase [Anaerolineae bacterium]|nr:type I methionyl aminopeptidase [Anaerolineae bacterium]
MAIYLKTREEIATMREAGRIVARAHEAMRKAVAPGVTTAELDAVAADVIRSHDALPTFLHYAPRPDLPPYPAVITACVNEELVHAIPGPRALKEGDIVSLDVGATYKGFVGDAAFTAGVGEIAPQVQRLLEVTEQALYEAIKVSRPGNRTRDIALAIQGCAEQNGYNVVREYGGHGVGRHMHEEPHIPNWVPRRRRRFTGVELRTGMTYAIEPMVMLGSPETRVLDDHWAVVTADGSLCAHFEHTIAITDGEAEILTLL